MKRFLLTACAVAALVSSPALAGEIASFQPIGDGTSPNISWTEAAGSAVGGTIAMTDAAVTFAFHLPTLQVDGLVAKITLTGTTGSAAFNTLGIDVQNGIGGSFHITKVGAQGAYADGDDLLSGTFTGGQIFGGDGGNVGSFHDTTLNLGSIVYSSGVATLPSGSSASFALSLNSVDPVLSIFNGGSHGAGQLRGFSGITTGSFGVETRAVPEASTWAMMLLGFGAMGTSLRARRSDRKQAAFA